MDNEDKLVIFDKYSNAVDANIVKGALETSGIPAGVISDSTANTVWMAPVPVVVFRRDLEAAIKALYDSDLKYEDYQDEMDNFAFENMRECNRVFCELALKIHPELAGSEFRDLYAQARLALEAGDIKTLNQIQSSLG